MIRYTGSYEEFSTGGVTYGGSIGDFAVFATGGTNILQIYDSNLTRNTSVTGTGIDNYRGLNRALNHLILLTQSRSEAIALDSSLTRTVLSANANRVGVVGSQTTSHALFAATTNSNYFNTVNKMVFIYDSQLSNSVVSNLNTALFNRGGAYIGDYALFGGGNDNSGYNLTKNDVDYYNDSLTHRITYLPDYLACLQGGFNGNYAFFIGGRRKASSGENLIYKPTVISISKSLSTSKLSDLPSPLEYPGTCNLDNKYCIVAGGYDWTNYKALTSVYSYDNSLTRVTRTSISIGRSQSGGAQVGEYAIIGGGSYGSGTAVDIYYES